MKRISVVVGNSTVRAALFEDMALMAQCRWTHAECGDEDRLLADLSVLGCGQGVAAVLCSVVPALGQVLRTALLRLGARVVDVDPLRGPMATLYRTPETLGADRYSAALAAREIYGAPVIVIDCGTALTINVVDAAGNFVGGSISPGFGTSFRMMSEGTAQLPLLGAIAEVPLVGGDTEESMRSGVLHMLRFGVAGMVRGIISSTGPDTPVIITGGDSRFLEGSNSVVTESDAEIVLRGGIFYLLFEERS